MISAEDQAILAAAAADHPYPLLFATVSGAHLYGFASEDSDFDVRGSHILPLDEVVGLRSCRETVEISVSQHGREIDVVTHDVRKFFGLLLKKNGYVLEQVLSPLVIRTSRHHHELRALALGCVTRHHSHHYLGMAATQWKLFEKGGHEAKPLLYVYRALLTGINMMRTGRVEANLAVLNREAGLAHVDELIERKRKGTEHGALENPDVEFHASEYGRLRALLESAAAASTLPERATSAVQLNDLLVRIRVGGS